MKNIKLLAVGSILLVAIFAWGSYAEPKTNQSAQRWEYKIVYTASEDELNRLGGQGWELTTVYGAGSTPYCMFKRAK